MLADLIRGGAGRRLADGEVRSPANVAKTANAFSPHQAGLANLAGIALAVAKSPAVSAASTEGGHMRHLRNPGDRPTYQGRSDLDYSGDRRLLGRPIAIYGVEWRVISAWKVVVEQCPFEGDVAARAASETENRQALLGLAVDHLVHRSAKRGADDSMRACVECLNLTQAGRCRAVTEGALLASRTYAPPVDLVQRCIHYDPWPFDPDRRSGRARWPSLVT